MSGIQADMATGAKGAAMARETVGVIGLGLMGEVLAGRLMAAGFGVKGYDIDPASRSPSASIRSGSQVLVQSTTVPAATAGSSTCTTTCST